ncbi:MAG: hypothetical protein EYC68_17140 [Chloroflexota bacterium]|nr:MAG: hypothetical protein EYC68_17140 [Chloroflexota bacterium]
MIENWIRVFETSRGWDAAILALVSVALFIAASNVKWSITRAPNSSLNQQLTRAAAQPVIRALFEIVRLLYYIGIPFAALYFGWIDLRAFGLVISDWAEGVRWAIVIFLAAWLLLMVVWLPYLRATADVYATPATQFSFPRRLVELIYMQAHWAFYRAAAIVFLTSSIPDAYYWGAVVGLGLTAIEALASPRIRERLTRIGEADGIVWNAGQAVINALGFVVTRNLYLLILIHFLLELSVPHLRAQARERTLTSPTRAQPQRIRES